MSRPLAGMRPRLEQLERMLARLRRGRRGTDDVERVRDAIFQLLAEVNHELRHGVAPHAHQAQIGASEARGAIEEAQGVIRETHGAVDELVARVDRLIVEMARLAGRSDASTAELSRVVRGQAQILREAVSSPARDAELERLRSTIPEATTRRAGLSVVTIAWNHAAFLPAAVDSALALLDELDADERGEVWILDNASTDPTREVLRELEDDPRVRTMTARVPLGLSRGRDVLLHAVPTRHALVLDADNTVLRTAAALYRHAVDSGAAFTFGPLLAHQPDGRAVALVSAEPPGAGYVTAPENSIDTMAVIDVGTVLDVGGYTRDPILEPVDDWELVHRLARRGATIGFVPTLAGRYRLAPLRHSTGAHDAAAVLSRLERSYRVDGVLAERGIEVDVATPEPPSTDERQPRQRVVVVSGGGVSNLGDDAILLATLDQLGRFRPHDSWAIDLVTDGDDLPALPVPCAWLGTRDEVAAAPDSLGLERGDLVVLAGGGGLAAPWEDSIVTGRAAIVRAAQQAGTPVIAPGQGIGPVIPRMRHELGEMLRACTAIGTRDALSLDAVRDLGAADRAELVIDDAVALVADLPPVAAPPGIDLDAPFVLLHGRVAGYGVAGAERWEAIGTEVDRLAAARGVPVLCLVVNGQPGREIGLATALATAPDRRTRWQLVDATTDAPLAATLCGRAEALVVGSYHLALFGLTAGRPSLIVADGDYAARKAEGLAGLLGHGPVALTATDPVSSIDARWRQLGDRLEPVAHAHARRAERWWHDALVAAGVVPAAALPGRAQAP